MYGPPADAPTPSPRGCRAGIATRAREGRARAESERRQPRGPRQTSAEGLYPAEKSEALPQGFRVGTQRNGTFLMGSGGGVIIIIGPTRYIAGAESERHVVSCHVALGLVRPRSACLLLSLSSFSL